MEKPTFLKNIQDIHTLANLKGPRHPLFAISRLENIPKLGSTFPSKLMYGFYGVSIKRNLNSYVRYGRKNYDFQKGVMGFTAPMQLIEFQRDIINGADGWLLFFQPELLAKHPLQVGIKKYGFFNYEVNEALHLSEEEESLIEGVFENISNEYQYPLDMFSKDVALSNIQLLLTYCERFFQRQFIVRESVESDFLTRFEKVLHQAFEEHHVQKNGIPMVNALAEQMGISSSYLSDSLKSVTGKTAQEHIHLHLIEKAKEKLLGSELSVSEIAYDLGFEYPQYFSRLFKEKTGFSPRAYRTAS